MSQSHILFCHATRQDDKNVCHDIGDKMKFFLDKIYFPTFFAEVSHLGRVLLTLHYPGCEMVLVIWGGGHYDPPWN